MDDRSSQESRRWFLRLTGCSSIIGVSGCISLGNEEVGGPPSQEPDQCLDQLDDSVPTVEANAVSIDGIKRKKPNQLVSKQQAGYQCGPSEGEHCGNCTFYIDDMEGDAIGACTEVKGEIRSADWCGLWTQRNSMNPNQG